MKGRMFLLGVSSRASGLHQLRTWHADLTQRIGSTHIGQLYLCDGRGFVFFSPFIVNGLKKELPVSMQPQSCLTFSPADGWRKEVGTPHRLMGYWLLCDGKGKIRWQSCGKWSEEGGVSGSCLADCESAVSGVKLVVTFTVTVFPWPLPQ